MTRLVELVHALRAAGFKPAVARNPLGRPCLRVRGMQPEVRVAFEGAFSDVVTGGGTALNHDGTPRFCDLEVSDEVGQ